MGPVTTLNEVKTVSQRSICGTEMVELLEHPAALCGSVEVIELQEGIASLLPDSVVLVDIEGSGNVFEAES